MANELAIDYPTGNTLYAYLLNAMGQIWNGAAFETPQNANWATYDIALIEAGTTGIYRGNMPTASAGFYSFVVRLQAGGAPAVADVSVGGNSFEWDGSEVGGLTAADVWSYSPRTLTQSAASVISAVEGSVVSVYQYNTWEFSLTGLGDITGRSELYFTAKENVERADASSETILQVEETIGLIYIGGEAAANPALGTLTVDNAALGNITVKIDETVTGIPSMDGRYDVKMITAAGDAQILTISVFEIFETVTRAV